MEEENKKSKKKVIITAIFIVIVTVSIIGVAFAYFSEKTRSDTKTITTANLDIEFTDNNDIINATNLSPLYFDEVMDMATKKTFTIKKTTTSENVHTSIYLTNLDLTKNFESENLKWAVFEGETKVSTGNFGQLGDDEEINLISNILLDNENERTFTLYIWIDETDLDQSSMENGSISGKITAVGELNESNLLTSKILGYENANVSKTDAFFSEELSNDSGLYTLKDDEKQTSYGFPIYYFRGNVNNNYVTFGTHKSDVTNKYENVSDSSTMDEEVAKNGSPILWKIMRINEDNSITMVSEYNIGNDFHVWNENGTADYVNDDGSQSTIKKIVDDWYTTTFSGESKLDNMIKITDFCNDRSDNYGAVNNRLRGKDGMKPTLECKRQKDIVKAKAGLMSADEMVYAGMYFSSVNTMLSWYSTGSFWSMSPCSNDNTAKACIFSVPHIQMETSSVSTGSAAARPVITIRDGVKIKSGDGTKNNPYVLSVQ